MSTKPRNHEEWCIHRQHHGWVRHDNYTNGTHEHLVNTTWSLLEFVSFFLLFNIGFHHTHVGDIFLDTIVEVVISLKHLSKERIYDFGNNGQNQTKEECYTNENPSHFAINQETCCNGKNQIKWCTHTDTDNHLVRILHVGNISHHTCYQTTSWELIDIFKREGLNLFENGLA